MSNWKVYEPIENVVGFDEHGLGPFRGPLKVTAHCLSVIGYRIALNLDDLAGCVLTVEQSRQLRAILERAEQDVLRGATEDPPEVSCG